MFLYYQDKISKGKLIKCKKSILIRAKNKLPHAPRTSRGARSNGFTFRCNKKKPAKKGKLSKRFLAELKAFAVLILTEPLSFGFGQLSSLRLSALRFADGSLRMRAPTGCSRLQ